MAVRAAVQYMARHILRELGLGNYVPAAVSVGATSMRVFDSHSFDPMGGQIIVDDNDNLVTYTRIEDDTLMGIPSSGTGSVTATINEVSNSSRDFIYRPEVSYYELEASIDRNRFHGVVEVYPDDEKLVYSSARGWFDTAVELRTSRGSSYTELTANTISYELGTFEFTTAKTYSILYAVGWLYNPFLVIADLIEAMVRDGRWSKYHSFGSSAESKDDAGSVADRYRARAAFLTF